MRRQGFTLIELLVVIAIIAVLMAVLMPALQRAGQGKRAVCLSNVKQFGICWVLYADENDQKIVNSCTIESSEGHNDRTEPCWMYFHADYTTEQRIDGIQRGDVALRQAAQDLQMSHRDSRRGQYLRDCRCHEWGDVEHSQRAAPALHQAEDRHHPAGRADRVPR